MPEKDKSIVCLVLSVAGWLVLVGGIVYAILQLGDSSEFTFMVIGGIIFACAATSFALHLMSVIYAIILICQGNRYKAIYITAICSSSVFILLVLALFIWFWY